MRLLILLTIRYRQKKEQTITEDSYYCLICILCSLLTCSMLTSRCNSRRDFSTYRLFITAAGAPTAPTHWLQPRTQWESILRAWLCICIKRVLGRIATAITHGPVLSDLLHFGWWVEQTKNLLKNMFISFHGYYLIISIDVHRL